VFSIAKRKLRGPESNKIGIIQGQTQKNSACGGLLAENNYCL
jgi:hypothetical protein